MKTEILNDVVLPYGCTTIKLQLIKRVDGKYNSFIVELNKTVIKATNSETMARQFLQKFITNIKTK